MNTIIITTPKQQLATLYIHGLYSPSGIFKKIYFFYTYRKSEYRKIEIAHQKQRELENNSRKIFTTIPKKTNIIISRTEPIKQNHKILKFKL